MTGGRLLQDQGGISKQFPMPVDDMSASSSIQTISGETVSLYYSNAGTRTVDAGQAAGVAVTFQLANKNILDAGGGYIGTKDDSSVSFTGDCLTTQIDLPKIAEAHIHGTWAEKLAAITANMSNGEFCIDHRSGTGYGVKATTTSSLTSTTYKVNLAQSGASGGLASSAKITDGTDTADVLARTTGQEAPAVTEDALVTYDVSAAVLVPFTHISPVDGAVAYTSSTSVTCSGFSFTVDDTNCYITHIDYYPSGSTYSKRLINGVNGVSMKASSNVITVAGAGTPFAASDTYNVGIRTQNKAFTAPNNWMRVGIGNRDSDKDTADTVAAVTNGTDGTYSYYVDWETFKNYALQSKISGGSGTVTYTLESSAQNDGTAAASVDYIDTTSALTGAASHTATTYHFLDTALVSKYLKIKVVAATGGANDGDWTFYFIKK